MNTSMIRVSLLALALTAGTAFAQPGDKPQDAPLKGPKVPERHVPGVENGLGTMQRGDKRDVAREQPIPHMAFMRMLNDAVGEKAPESVRLSDDQRSQVEKISSEFTQKLRTYSQSQRTEVDKLVEQYGPEVRQLVQRMVGAQGGMPGARGKDGARPGADRPAKDAGKEGGDAMDGSKGLSDEARAEVVAKLKEMQAGAPKAEDARTAIWGVLKPEQQAAVQKNVDAFKAQREKEADEKYKEREKKKLEERGTKKPGGDKGKDAAAPKSIDAARRAELVGQLPADLKERFEKLPEAGQERVLGKLNELSTPEQREEFYANLRERLKDAEGGTRRKSK